MTLTITGCKDCPLSHIDSEWPTICTHPKSPDRNIEYEYYDPIHGKDAPHWCPLHNQILIIIKQ